MCHMMCVVLIMTSFRPIAKRVSRIDRKTKMQVFIRSNYIKFINLGEKFMKICIKFGIRFLRIVIRNIILRRKRAIIQFPVYCLLHYFPCSASEQLYVYSAPCLWNSLSLEVRSARSVGSFRARLKTHLYRRVTYPP